MPESPKTITIRTLVVTSANGVSIPVDIHTEDKLTTENGDILVDFADGRAISFRGINIFAVEVYAPRVLEVQPSGSVMPQEIMEKFNNINGTKH